MQKVWMWLGGLAVAVLPAFGGVVGYSSSHCVSATHAQEPALNACARAVALFDLIWTLQPNSAHRSAEYQLAYGRQLVAAGKTDQASRAFREAFISAQRDDRKIYELGITRAMRDLLVTIHGDTAQPEATQLWWSTLFSVDPLEADRLRNLGET